MGPAGCHGTKNTSESKPSATAALGARKSTWRKTEKNVRTAPVVLAKIRPDQKWEKTTARGLPWGPKTHRNQSQAQLRLSEPENPPGSPGEKLKKKRKDRACRLSQNSARKKMGQNHCPRAAMGTKNTSESKPTTTAALGAKNPPLHMGISPGEKLKKTTGPRLLSEPKFDLIKKGKKPPPTGCRGYHCFDTTA